MSDMQEILLFIALSILFVSTGMALFLNAIRNVSKEDYDLFRIQNSKLIVFTGFPPRAIAYEISEIKEVTFLITLSRFGTCGGIMRIVKKDGHRSRPFIFDNSVYHKRFVLNQSFESMKQTMDCLMEELRKNRISCRLE